MHYHTMPSGLSVVRPHPRSPGRRARGFTLVEMMVVVVILAAVAALVVSLVDGTLDQAEATVTQANLTTVRDALQGSAAAPGYLADMKHVPGFDPLDVRTAHLLEVPAWVPAGFREFDLASRRGWRGPYLARAPGVANLNPAPQGGFPFPSDRRFAGDDTFAQRGFFPTTLTTPYGTAGERAIADPWGNPIVLQIPNASAFQTPTDAKRHRYARLVSAGPDGVLSTPFDDPPDILVLTPDQRIGRLGGRLLDGTAPSRGDDLVIFLNRNDVHEPEEP